MAALSLLEPSAPTYDPWAWIEWGRELAHGSLSTVDGPSWKPLPVLICSLLSGAGAAAPALWLLLARAGGLVGMWATARCAARLSPRAGRWPAMGVATIVLIEAGLNFALPGDGFLGSVWAGNSEGLLVACVFGAGLSLLDRHPGRAWALTVAAALLRPEAWPFALALAVWLWWQEPRLRPWLLGGLTAVPLLWFGAELLGSDQLFRGAARARAITPDNPTTTGQAARTVLSRARSYLPIVVQAAVLLATGWALLGLAAGRRAKQPARGGPDAAVVALALFGAVWLALVAVMAQARLASGNPRYVLLCIAAAAALAGVGVGRLCALGRRPALGWATAAVALLVLAAGALPQLRGIGHATRHLRYEGRLISDLDTAVRRGGGADTLLRCGPPVTGPLEVTAVAWRLGVPIHRVGLEPVAASVVFRVAATLDDPVTPAATAGLPVRARAGGWSVLAACPLR